MVCVDARQLRHAPHNAARQNPTSLLIPLNMMPLVCRQLRQCTDDGITERFGQLHAHTYQGDAASRSLRALQHCAISQRPRSHAHATWVQLSGASRMPRHEAPRTGPRRAGLAKTAWSTARATAAALRSATRSAAAAFRHCARKACSACFCAAAMTAALTIAALRFLRSSGRRARTSAGSRARSLKPVPLMFAAR